MGKKVELVLDGLHCAGCAAKIEDKVSKLDEVDEASLNFARSILILETSTKEVDNLVNKVTKIVDNTERGVDVKLKTGQSEKKAKGTIADHINKKELIILLIGLAIFAVALGMKGSQFELIIFIVSYVIIGGSIIRSAFRGVTSGELFDENFLMVIATFAAFFVGEYPEAVAVMIFFRIGELFQDAAVDRSRKSIADIMDIRPDYANLFVLGIVNKVNPEDVKYGDTILVKTGEKIPLDGEIIEGKAALDTSALTGESLPLDVEVGDEVYSGAINLNGLLKIKVTKIFQESTVSKILDLVQNASSRKGETEKFITKFAKIYTPIVVFAAVLVSIIPPFILGIGEFSQWVYRAAIFLVVSCPCALVVSIPLGYFAGLGSASKNGILIKGSNFLEALYNVKHIAFDKTGTLTKGVFKVVSIETTDSFSEDEILKYASIAENNSQHPIAKAIVKKYNKSIDEFKINNYEEIAGKGINATTIENDKEILISVGNSKLMKEIGADFSLINKPGTHIYVAINKVFAGSILISDEVKEESEKTIASLKNMNISEIAMVTGDNEENARFFANKVGLDKFYHSLLPGDKVSVVEEIKSKIDASSKDKLIFVGDGINDAPVLARADIGVAMGGIGSDAAIEAADVVIMDDDMTKIPKAIQIANRTRKIVMQNIVFSIGIKLAVLLLAVIGKSTMWIAIFADVGVALLAVLNSMRILKD
ncbi:heavy metal translocating P-type ATPase [Clostridium sediminicola]|uniref:heavy metal translocating P-type ATPase n=1 Tax=Clostridium sediminicola TaxID=3114879 RepID=UPI0031F24278